MKQPRVRFSSFSFCVRFVSVAPVKAVQDAVKRGHLGDLNPTPWAFMTGNCLGWVAYSFLIGVSISFLLCRSIQSWNVLHDLLFPYSRLAVSLCVSLSIVSHSDRSFAMPISSSSSSSSSFNSSFVFSNESRMSLSCLVTPPDCSFRSGSTYVPPSCNTKATRPPRCVNPLYPSCMNNTALQPTTKVQKMMTTTTTMK